MDTHRLGAIERTRAAESGWVACILLDHLVVASGASLPNLCLPATGYNSHLHACCCCVRRSLCAGGAAVSTAERSNVRKEVKQGSAYTQETRKIILSLSKIRKVRQACCAVRCAGRLSQSVHN